MSFPNATVAPYRERFASAASALTPAEISSAPPRRSEVQAQLFIPFDGEKVQLQQGGWCASHNLSLAFFDVMKRECWAPRTMNVGKNKENISAEADADWIAEAAKSVATESIRVCCIAKSRLRNPAAKALPQQNSRESEFIGSFE